MRRLHLLPGSLRWRTLLLTLAAIILCQVITFTVFASFRNDFLTKRGQQFVASYVSLVRTALERSPPEEVARHLANTPGMQIRLIKDPPFPARSFSGPQAVIESSKKDLRDSFADGLGPNSGNPISPNASPNFEAGGVFPIELFRLLNRTYGFGTVRRTLAPQEALWIYMHPKGWWLMIPATGFEAPLPWPIILSVIAAISLIAALVSLYVVQLSRPLRALADAAARFELGQRPQLPLTGPDEIRAVTSQFNAMVDRLTQNDVERRIMLAGLPHDLRAPLTRAKLRLSLMDTAEEAETRLGFERDLNEVERIANQFVAYLRGLNSDKSAFADCDMENLLGEVVHAWHGTGQQVLLEQADACLLNVDRDALCRAIDNLISNALTHGAPPVRIRGVQESATYCIYIDDQGKGIPASLREEALKPFSRLDAARSTAGHCGLGLAVVLEVVRLHGGALQLDTAASGGLSAILVLPCAPASTDAMLAKPWPERATTPDLTT